MDSKTYRQTNTKYDISQVSTGWNKLLPKHSEPKSFLTFLNVSKGWKESGGSSSKSCRTFFETSSAILWDNERKTFIIK